MTQPLPSSCMIGSMGQRVGCWFSSAAEGGLIPYTHWTQNQTTGKKMEKSKGTGTTEIKDCNVESNFVVHAISGGTLLNNIWGNSSEGKVAFTPRGNPLLLLRSGFLSVCLCSSVSLKQLLFGIVLLFLSQDHFNMNRKIFIVNLLTDNRHPPSHRRKEMDWAKNRSWLCEKAANKDVNTTGLLYWG